MLAVWEYTGRVVHLGHADGVEVADGGGRGGAQGVQVGALGHAAGLERERKLSELTNTSPDENQIEKESNIIVKWRSPPDLVRDASKASRAIAGAHNETHDERSAWDCDVDREGVGCAAPYSRLAMLCTCDQASCAQLSDKTRKLSPSMMLNAHRPGLKEPSEPIRKQVRPNTVSAFYFVRYVRIAFHDLMNLQQVAFGCCFGPNCTWAGSRTAWAATRGRAGRF
jgi:hypothetical protein